MAYDNRHNADYRQLNIKLHYDSDADVIAFFDNVPNMRLAVCAVVREWLKPFPEQNEQTTPLISGGVTNG